MLGTSLLAKSAAVAVMSLAPLSPHHGHAPPVQHHAHHSYFIYDSTTASAIPSSATVVAGYTDGAYAWTPADWARFPHALHVRVDILGGDTSASVEDVENGGVSVNSIHSWAVARQAKGYIPVVYCSYGTVPSVVQAMKPLKVWQLWIATPNGVAANYPGAAATQYLWANGYDQSITSLNPWWLFGHH